MGIYEKLGVRTIINAHGTVTRIGGSLVAPEVIEAMADASRNFVDLNEFHKAAGKYVAKLLGAEACCITCGAAAGLAISTAACIARMNAAARLQLPDTTGLKNEVIVMKCHRILYDQAVRLSGAKFVEVGVTSFTDISQIEAAINDRTAAFFYAAEAEPMRGSIPLKDISPIMKRHKVPIIVDAAAELPPVSNLTRFHREGADLVVFSGGKEVRGPQASGFVLGDAALIEACDACCCPNYGVGRPMKIDKETIAGFVKAIELFIQRDFTAQDTEWSEMSKRMAQQINESGLAEVRLGYPDEPGIQPVNILRVYVRPTAKGAADVQKILLNGNPYIFAGTHQDEVVLNPQCLKAEEVQIVTDRMIEALKQ